MDTNVHPRIWGYAREDFIESKQVLMDRSRVLMERGRDALMQDLQQAYADEQAATERPTPAATPVPGPAGSR
jgi:predicted metal-dependent hydrolase